MQNLKNFKKTKKSKKIFKISAFIVGILLALFIFFAAGYTVGKITEGKIKLNVNSDIYKETELSNVYDNSLLKQIWTIIQSDYVDQEKIDEKELFYGSIKGFVNALDDPYTVFLDPQTTEDFEDQIAGSFEGIGAQIAIKDDILTIIAPLEGSPAKQAGLRPGDKVLSVDEVDISGMSIDEVVHLIRGPKGTMVKLLIYREGEETQEIEIIRDVIKLKSVAWEFRTDGLVYIQLAGFNGDTIQLFNQLAREIEAQNPKGIILDMRNNPGGLLDVAIDICSFWLDDKLIVSEQFGDGTMINHKCEPGARFDKYPTVILMNEGSASGSEIVAGAFQDYQIASAVGEKSFGKGSVQALKKMPDGSSIKITVAKWLTPKGRIIDGQGLEADYEVEYTKEDFENQIDPQLDKAVQLLLEK